MRILERPHPAYTVRAYIYAYREKVFEQIEATLPPETFAYFSALFLGNRATERYPKIRRLFNRWGITHYLARSGLHIALLIFLWSLLLLCIPAPLVIKQCALAALIACYSALSWPSISFARAIILWLLYTAALLVRRPAQPLYLLSMISLVVVLLWPANALCLDFQLSFFLTAVLMLMSYKNNTHFISDDLHSHRADLTKVLRHTAWYLTNNIKGHRMNPWTRTYLQAFFAFFLAEFFCVPCSKNIYSSGVPNRSTS